MTFFRIRSTQSAPEVQLMVTSAGVLSVKILAKFSGFVVTLLLARLLGPEGLGVFSSATAWLGLLATVTSLGLHQLLTREMARLSSDSSWSLALGLLRFSYVAVFIASIIVLMIVYPLLDILYSQEYQSEIHLGVLLGLLALPFLSFLRIQQGALRGLGKITLSQVPEFLTRPLIFICLIGVFFAAPFPKITSHDAILMFVLATLVSFWISRRFLISAIPDEKFYPSLVYRRRKWLILAAPLAIIGVMQVINSHVDIIMLGTMTDSRTTGIYKVAVQVSWLILAIVSTINTSLGPSVSRLYWKGDLERLQKLVTLAARIGFAGALVLWCVFFFYGRFILELFGAQYTESYVALMVLSSAFLACSLTAAVGPILMMTNYTKLAMRATAIGAVLNIPLNYVLIILYGSNGAAVASATSMIVVNFILAIEVIRRLRLNPTIGFGVIAWSAHDES